ncbi:MAG: hypothetical protein ABI868_07675 [Acidobacteriota bacterium]
MTQNPADDPAVLDPFLEDEPSFDLKRFISVLWSYRNIVLAAGAVTLPVYLAAAITVYMLQPLDRFARLQFELRFDGADRGRYPNELRFSEQDILADTVLTAVFERNDLQRYGAFAVFKGGLFVAQSSPEREALDFEYRTKLADTKLSPVDRVRLEEEYHRKSDTLKKVGYTLNYHRLDRFAAPPTLETKFMLDILSEWAAQAVGRRGVLKYDVHLPSAAIQPNRLDTVEDAWLAVQALARKATLVMKACEKIMALPGASLQRIGEFKISVTDLRTATDELRRSRIAPLARELGSAPSVGALLREQVQLSIANRNAGRERVKSLQSALSAYDLTSVPGAGRALVAGGVQNGAQPGEMTATQLSESFLDKVVELSARANNQDYRQRLTNQLIDEGRTLAELEADAEFLQALLTVPGVPFPPGEGREARIRQVEQELSATIKGLEQIYEDLSMKNLNPGTALYAATGPVYTAVERSFDLRRAVLYGVLTELIVVMVAALICGIHALMTATLDRTARV